MLVSDERPRARATLLRGRSDYRLAFRLFEHVLGQGLSSAPAADLFLRQTVPIVKCRALPSDDRARRCTEDPRHWGQFTWRSRCLCAPVCR